MWNKRCTPGCLPNHPTAPYPACRTHPPCRLLVLFIFPATLMSSYALRAVVFFKRGKIPDKEASTLVAA